MTTFAYVGRPGSGKSYSVVENQIVPALKSGRRVVTNIPLHLDEIRKLPSCENANVVEFPVDAVRENPARITEFVKPGDVFVLDEVSKIWPAGEKMKDVPPEYVAFLTEHRHMVDEGGNSVVIILVVQDLGNIGLWALRLVDFTYNHTKLSVVGASGSYRCDIYEGPVKGPNYPVKRRVRFVVGRYTKKVYALYKSHTQSESSTSGANEKSMDGRATILKRFGVAVGVPLGIISVFVGFHYMGRAMEDAKRPPGSKAVAVQPPGPAASPSMLSGLGGGARELIEQPARFRIVGTAMNEARPGLSRVALQGEGKLVVSVPYTVCKEVAGELLCPYRGFYYDEQGLAPAKYQGAAVLPPDTYVFGLGSLKGSAQSSGVVDHQVVVKARSAGVELGAEDPYSPIPLVQDPVTGVATFASRKSGLDRHVISPSVLSSSAPSAPPSQSVPDASVPRRPGR